MVGAVFAAVMTIAMGLVSVELNEMQGLLDTREDAEKERVSAKLTIILSLITNLKVKCSLRYQFGFAIY